MLESIESITDPEFRTGQGKNGPWTLLKIKTDSGKDATVFAPAAIGDPVSLEFNEQYKSYSAKVVTGAKMEAIVAEEKKEDQLKQINDKLDKILQIIEVSPPEDPEDIPPF